MLLPFCTSSPWLGRVVEGLQNSPCGPERTAEQGGGEARVRGLELTSREARHWLRSRGLGLRRELPAPHHSLPLPPRAPWLLSLPAGPLPSQTAARGRGRSISEQRGPCGLQFKPRIPLSDRQVKKGSLCTCTQACMTPGRPGRRARGLGMLRGRGWDGVSWSSLQEGQRDGPCVTARRPEGWRTRFGSLGLGVGGIVG